MILNTVWRTNCEYILEAIFWEICVLIIYAARTWIKQMLEVNMCREEL